MAGARGYNVISNQKYFPAEKILYLKDCLSHLDERKFDLVTAVDLKDPTTVLIVSLFFGGLGVDRFMLGQVGTGIFKLLTLGGFGIMTVIDWFTAQKERASVT